MVVVGAGPCRTLGLFGEPRGYFSDDPFPNGQMAVIVHASHVPGADS